MFSSNSLKPLVAPVLRRLLPAQHLHVEVLQEEETEHTRLAVYLPGMLDRVTATDQHSVLAQHLEAAHATHVTHAPVLRRVYPNALVRRNGFATWRYNEPYGPDRKLRELLGPVVRVPRLRYCHSYVSWCYFGHWMTDSIPMSFIEPEQGVLWMPPDPSWKDAQDYLAALDLTVVDAPLVQADELIVYQDFGQGSHKRRRYDEIRSRMRAVFGDVTPTDLVYLRRGHTGARRVIANEQALIDALVARNWKIIDIEEATVARIQTALCRAQVVLSMDGSHIGHAHMSLAAGSTMVVMVPSDRFTTVHAGRCLARGVSHGLLVLAGSGAQGYMVEPDEVLRTVERAQEAGARL